MTTLLRSIITFFIIGHCCAIAEKPNFVIIFTDDQGYGDVSVYGKSDVITPNIDRIGTEGMLFTAMRANSTVCTPSRAALLTGKYADRVGAPGVIRTNANNSWGFLDPSATTLADELKKAGYHTALIGKWHLGLTSPNLPNERGFDHFHGFLGGMMDDYYQATRGGINFLRLNSEVIQPTGHATDMFTDWTDSYLKNRSKKPDQPFFLYLAYNAPHYPIQPPKEWFEKVRNRAPELKKSRARSVAFVEHLDSAVGRVMDALKKYGMDENTIVVFCSDNGGSLRHSQNNDPWRGGKQDHYDGGIRVPFMMRWPAQIKAGSKSDYQGLNFDLFPTFLEIAGVKLDADLDAVSLMPLIKGEKIEEPRELYFVRREGGARAGKSYEALIVDGWKLMQNGPFSPLELYNLNQDPQETKDLSSAEPTKFKVLTDRLRHHIQRGGVVPWQSKSQNFITPTK